MWHIFCWLVNMWQTTMLLSHHAQYIRYCDNWKRLLHIACCCARGQSWRDCSQQKGTGADLEWGGTWQEGLSGQVWPLLGAVQRESRWDLLQSAPYWSKSSIVSPKTLLQTWHPCVRAACHITIQKRDPLYLLYKLSAYMYLRCSRSSRTPSTPSGLQYRSRPTS